MYIALHVLWLGFAHIIVLFSNVYPNFNNDHKDFNSVPHRPLLQKLKNWVYNAHSVHPHTLRLITHYLCQRSQCVCGNSSSSGVLPVINEVPQGLCWTILVYFYINDTTMVPLSDDGVCHSMLISALPPYSHNLCVWKMILTTSVYGLMITFWCKCMIISRRKQPSLPDTTSQD